MNTSIGLLKRYTLAVLLAVSLLAVPNVCGMSLIALSPQQVTERTDIWVRANVVSVSGPLIRTTEFGDRIRDITMQLQILESTDPKVVGAVTIREETGFHHQFKPGSQVFAAFKKEGNALKPVAPFGAYGWIAITPDGIVEQRSGGVHAETYWRWLRGIRVAADTRGRVSDEELAFWTKAVASNDPGVAGLAMSFFESVDTSTLKVDALFDAFLNAYGRSSKWTNPSPEQRYESRQQMMGLAAELTTVLASLDANGVGGPILDLIEFDAGAAKLFDESEIRESFLALMQHVTDPVILARIPNAYDSFIRPGHTEFKLVPTAPSPEIDAWLWDITYNPAEHGVRDELQLAGVWTALANRKNAEVLPYLQKVVAGDQEILVPFERYKEYAAEIIIDLESKILKREERLTRWVARIKRHESDLLSPLSQAITPEDRFLIPELATLTINDWLAGSHSPPYYPAAKIMQTLPDPVFAPLLLEWTVETPSADLLKALTACGESAVAIERTVAALEHDPPIARQDVRQASREKADLLLFLGSFGKAELAKHIVPFTEPDTLQEYERAYLATIRDNREKRPYPVWDLRDAAFIALAKSGSPQANVVLKRAHKDNDIRVRMVAALSLYALGDDTGADLVQAYRTRTERSIPELEERWYFDFAGGNVFRQVISYLDSPQLDTAFLERTKLGFGEDDRGIASDPNFFARHRTEMLDTLAGYLDDTDPRVRDIAAYCLRMNTKQDFGYQNDALAIEQQSAIIQWKQYVAENRVQ